MAKQIFIQFTSDGAIVQQESSASNIRQGDAGGEVTIVAAFAGRSNADYVARAHFERPDGKHANVVMIPSHQTTNRFEYVIQSAWFFAVAGTAKVTITITDSGGAVSAQGLYAFEIAATTVDVIDSTLTYDEAAALEGLIAQQSEALQSAVAKLMNGETVVGKALRDADGNIISQTYAQDSRVVHLEGNERVYGTKEFVGTIKANSLIPHAGNSAIGDSEDGRWEIGYFKYVDIGYIKSGNLLLTLPNAGGVLVTETGAQSIANTAKEQAIAFANTYTDNQKNALQTEIDAINATQNVVDIVGTKANLLAYDTTNLQSDDKIEVLVDESQSNANTIYSWNGSAWVLVGSKAPYYSVAQIDALLAYYVTAIGLSTTLEDYATKAYLADAINENCITLDKGGYVNLAEAPSSPNVYYFGAKNGTTSFLRLSDNSFDVKTTRGDVVMQFMLNFSNSNLARFVKIDGSTTPSTMSVTDIPFKAGVHSLVLDDDLDEANTKITALESKAAKQESDIQYLYRQVIGGGDLVTQTDSRVALTSQPFPLTVSPKALLDYVGGMCQKVNQLVSSVSNASGTINAGEYKELATVKVGGYHKLLVIASVSSASLSDLKWRVVGKDASDNYKQVESAANVTAFMTELKNYDSTDGLYIRLVNTSESAVSYSDASVMLVDLTAIYGAGNEPTTTSDARIQWLMSYLASHPEYDAGSIITAPVTMVLSKGFNVWDEQWEVGSIRASNGEPMDDSTTIRSKNFIAVDPTNAYYTYIESAGAGSMQVFFYDKNKNYIGNDYYGNRLMSNMRNAHFIKFRMGSAYGTTYKHDICINVSNASMNGTYMPYRAPIEYPIPAEVRALEGYGWGFDSDCNNHTSFERKKQVKMIARVDLGSLNYSFNTGNMYYSSGLSSVIKKPTANTDVVNAKCATYEIVAYYSHSGSSDMKISVSAEGTLYITNANATDTENLKTLLSGVYLYYEIATPTETDISEYIDSDVIVVSAGGYLEFENENDMGVPYSATYQCEPNP